MEVGEQQERLRSLRDGSNRTNTHAYLVVEIFCSDKNKGPWKECDTSTMIGIANICYEYKVVPIEKKRNSKFELQRQHRR